MKRRALALVVVALAGCGGSDDHGLVVGVVDDAARSEPGLLSDELVESGFDALAVSSLWDPGVATPKAEELTTLQAVANMAGEHDVRLFLIVYPRGSAATPLSPEARDQFASYTTALVRAIPELRDVIVGNEPNLNRFWLPQFGPGGENVAAPAYLALLAGTYDSVKATRDDVRIWGGATAPRGIDRPYTGRDTHSPTVFIRDLGLAYRASGRDRPVMDGFVHHPYAESSLAPVDQPHPLNRTIGLADYDKLVDLLGEAFDGTAQPGSDLPLLYGEVGVETAVPAEQRHLYESDEVAPVASEEAQAEAYGRVLELVACQPTVAGVLLFHVRDEPRLEGWQSGVRYANGVPKTSHDRVAEAVRAARDGELDVRCAR